MSTETSGVPWNMLRKMILTLKNHLLPFAFSISPQIFMKENFYTSSTKAKCPHLLRTEDWAIFSITVTLRPLQRHLTGNGSPDLGICNFLLLRMLLSMVTNPNPPALPIINCAPFSSICILTFAFERFLRLFSEKILKL